MTNNDEKPEESGWTGLAVILWPLTACLRARQWVTARIGRRRHR